MGFQYYFGNYPWFYYKFSPNRFYSYVSTIVTAVIYCLMQYFSAAVTEDRETLSLYSHYDIAKSYEFDADLS